MRVRSGSTVGGSVVAVVLAAGCATTTTTTRDDTTGAIARGWLPVYYALPPTYAWRSLGDVSVSARGDGAHLDELLTDAESRARRLGAEALIVRDLRTDARYEPQTVWRACGAMGMRGFGTTCPVTTHVLTVVSRLEGLAIVRDPTAVAPTSVWRPPPPLGAAGSSLPHEHTEAAPTDLDDIFTPP